MDFKEFSRSRAVNEASKNTLMDDYGSFWGLTGEVIGNWGLAIVGAAFDGLVLYGIAYLATRNHFLSVVTAACVALMIQLISGNAVMKVAKNWTKKDYRKKGFGKQLVLVSMLAAIMLVASFYLSWNTDKPVEARLEQVLESQIEDTHPIKAEYDRKRIEERKEYERQVMELRRQSAKLQSDKVRDRDGRLVTRWANLKPINDITTRQIPELTRSYQTEIDTLNAREAREFALAVSGNNKREKKAETRTVILGGATRYFNVGFQLLRVIILWGYMVFLIEAMPQKIAAAPSPLATVRNSLTDDFTVARLTKEVATLRDQLATVGVQKTATVPATVATVTERKSVPKGTVKRSNKRKTKRSRSATVATDRVCMECGTDIRHKKKNATFCCPDHRVVYWKKHKA